MYTRANGYANQLIGRQNRIPISVPALWTVGFQVPTAVHEPPCRDSRRHPGRDQSMSADSPECPTCGRTDFKSELGMRQHHARVHGENLSNVTLECDQCGDAFERHPAAITDSPNDFCGEGCYGEFFSDNYSGENSTHWKEGCMVTCDCCGTEFHKYENRINRSERHYCSWECSLEHRGEWMVGENHPRFNESNHRTGFNEPLKEAVRARDNFKCQYCGVTQENHIVEHGTRLHVHHIIPIDQFENPRLSHKKSNLVTLCCRCHKKWEGIPGLRPDTG